MYELELEDIDGVYEDVDGAPIARISSLVDGGLYFARPTEVRMNFAGRFPLYACPLIWSKA